MMAIDMSVAVNSVMYLARLPVLKASFVLLELTLSGLLLPLIDMSL